MARDCIYHQSIEIHIQKVYRTNADFPVSTCWDGCICCIWLAYSLEAWMWAKASCEIKSTASLVTFNSPSEPEVASHRAETQIRRCTFRLLARKRTESTRKWDRFDAFISALVHRLPPESEPWHTGSSGISRPESSTGLLSGIIGVMNSLEEDAG